MNLSPDWSEKLCDDRGDYKTLSMLKFIAAAVILNSQMKLCHEEKHSVTWKTESVLKDFKADFREKLKDYN